MTAPERMRHVLFIALLIVGSIPAGNVMGVMVNRPAPDFTLQSTTGKEITLSQFRGKKLVLVEFYAINFGAT